MNGHHDSEEGLTGIVASRRLLQYYAEITITWPEFEQASYSIDDQLDEIMIGIGDRVNGVGTGTIARRIVDTVVKASYKIACRLPGTIEGIEQARIVQDEAATISRMLISYTTTITKKLSRNKEHVEYQVQVGGGASHNSLKYWILVSMPPGTGISVEDLALRALTVLEEEAQHGYA